MATAPPPAPAAAPAPEKVEKDDKEREKDEASLLKEFMQDVGEARRLAECDRILRCFKLNPYDILGLGTQELSTSAEIRRKFRQTSLLVHPDKCSHLHPRAKEVFEMVQKAYEALQDAEGEQKKDVDGTLRHAREELRKERKKLVQRDNAYLAACAMKGGGDREKGREALEREYEASSGFQERLRLKAQELMTQLEWRRRQLGKRVKGEKERVEKEEEKSRKAFKKKAEEKKTWEKGTQDRVSNWRDFMKGNKSKKIKKKKVKAVKKVEKVGQAPETTASAPAAATGGQQDSAR